MLWGRPVIAGTAMSRSGSAASTTAQDQAAGGSSRNSPHLVASAAVSSTSLLSDASQISMPDPRNITQFSNVQSVGVVTPAFISPLQPPPAPMPASMQGTSNQPRRSAPPSHTHTSNISQAQELPPHNTVALPGQPHTSLHVLPQSPPVRNSMHDLHNISDDFLRSWAAAAGPLIQPLQDIEKAFRPRP